MNIKPLKNCAEFIAGDHTILRETLHGPKENLPLGYSLAHATVKPGLFSIRHSLKTSEVYYILEGEGLMHINEETSKVFANDTIEIPPHSIQYIENIGTNDLKFLCIVDPAWKVEDEEIL